MSGIRVLIIEDSAVVRELLIHIIESDPRLEVIGASASAEEALEQLDTLNPDVITMDIRLPGMNGFQATQRIMAMKPTPIVVVSGSVNSDDLRISINALRAGALTVIEKPVGLTNAEYEKVSRQLCDQLVLMSEIQPIRQNLNRAVNLSFPSVDGLSSPASPFRKEGRIGSFSGLGIVASTGGPNALMHALNGFGEDFPLPIFIVQHIADSFLPGFVEWLNSVSPQPVRIAKNLEIPAPGIAYLPPADHHLILKRGAMHLDQGEKVCHQRPSGDVLLKSMAESMGSSALGVVLTGMGEDGAAGLLAIRQKGGYTLAENAETAVIYGMPKTAASIGAAIEIAPLDEIAIRIRSLVFSHREPA